jgi:Icc-related predicted phosphoesterase
MLSCSWTNPTPWHSPREESEDALLTRLNSLAEQLEPDLPTIFNLHCPPYDTPLDRAPQLTDDLRVVTDGSEPRIISVGSTAVRELIEEIQPVLSLHGHIHESKAVAKLGRTTCINPGSAYSEGVIDGALVELRAGTLASHQLVTG